MKLTIRPLTPDLWPALEDLFDTTGPCSRCWCIYWRIGSAYLKRPREKKRPPFERSSGAARLRACSPSTATWPWAGASSRRAMSCRGLIAGGGSSAWTMRRSGHSPASPKACAQGLSQAGRHLGPDRRSGESRPARQGARARSLSLGCGRVAERNGHGLCLHLHARWVQDRGAPHAGASDHAPRFEGDRALMFG